jgi:hypothetical protein
MSRWTFPHLVGLVLVAMLACTVWELFQPESVKNVHGYGGDFRQFYIAGWVVDYGNPARLYDQSYFRQLQRTQWNDDNPFASLYPPALALAAAPLALLPMTAAMIVWWLLQAICFLAVGRILWIAMPIEPPWRRIALLALYCTFPVWLVVSMGQLTGMLLLVLTGGMVLHLGGRRMAAGCVLSALALKPHFALAICLWLLLRKDTKAGSGMLIGLGLQAIAVIACLGPSAIVHYVRGFAEITQHVKVAIHSPAIEQSFSGIVGRRLWCLGYDPRAYGNAFLLTQLVFAGLAGFVLWRVVQASGQLQRQKIAIDLASRYECAAAVLFMLVLTPYLLMYDLTLLLLPIACLWSSPGWRMGIVLYASITLVFAFVYLWLDFSLVPFLALFVLSRIAGSLQSLVLEQPAVLREPSFPGLPSNSF